MRRIFSTFRRFIRPTETIVGYEEPELIELIFQKTKAFSQRAEWKEMCGVSSVLDFGGGCGIHYKLALPQSPDIRWAVVETPAMVQRASQCATANLRFFTSIREAANWLGPIHVMHSNSALQYAPNPQHALALLCGLQAKVMLWQRLVLSKGSVERTVQISNLRDNGPGKAPGSIKNKSVRYELTRIPESVFLGAHRDYHLEDRGKDWFRFTLRQG
jgi:putative methyltransferase (TIGR04325 family)